MQLELAGDFRIHRAQRGGCGGTAWEPWGLRSPPPVLPWVPRSPRALLGTGLSLLWVCKARNPFTDGSTPLHPCRTAVSPWGNEAAP